MRGVWRRYCDVATQEGAAAARRWLLDRTARRAINFAAWEFVALAPGDVKLAGDPPQGYEFGFVAPEVLRPFLSEEYELGDKHLARLEAGHDLCFAVIAHDGRLAAYGWYALGSIEAEEADCVSLSFPARLSFMYKGFTHPAFRGQRLHGYVMRLALEELVRSHGVDELISTVHWLNTPSLKSCDRLGYRRLGRITRIGWGASAMVFAPKCFETLGIRCGRKADLSSRRMPRAQAEQLC